MTIDDKLIDYLEQLSKLRLTPEEQEAAKTNLADILGYMDKLGELDTEGVKPLSQPFPAANVFREDEVAPSTNREEILANAPKSKDGCFLVPKTIE